MFANHNKEMSAISEKEWIIETTSAEESVHQTNGHDCGVLQMLYVQHTHLSKGLPFTFTCDDCPDARRRIAYELLTGKLIV